MNPIDWAAIILGCPGLIEMACGLLLARCAIRILEAVDDWAGWTPTLG